MTPNMMAFVRRALALSTVVACVMTAVPAGAETLEQALVKRYPAGSIGAVQTARAALTDVDAARREVERHFADRRAVCFDKFFTASCLSEAKDERRVALSNVRKVEVEANAFLRKEKAAERDRTIAERQNRAARPLDGPSIPITGAARDASSPDDAADKAGEQRPPQPEKP